ncbi:MAG: hypothetical protein DRP45_03260 [Candidatus Zixiibacteriota bacterium]|nr:MAG: hypothetical protein DRP45_03260 [candidate division Zixibacteria bacterium]
MSRKVLLICYYFPPLGLGGVGRPLNLFKKLPDYGWDCHILTVKPVAYRAYEPELLDTLDKSRIHRSGSHDPQRLLYLLGVRQVKAATISKGRSVSEKFFPDSKVGWVKPAIRLGRRLCKKHRYDLLLSTSPPISSHLVGLQLKKEFQIPWIADFRDYWTAHKIEDSYSDAEAVSRAKRLLDSIGQETTAITAVNGTVADYCGKAKVITNGYDSDLANDWKSPPGTDRFTIGLLGHQHDTREIEPLLKLLCALRDHNPKQFNSIRLLQVGQMDEGWFRQLLCDHGLELDTDLRGRQGRRDTIRILSQSHLFYMGVPTEGGDVFLPGRTFDFLASGRPLLVYASPQSEISRFFANIDRAFCFEDGQMDQAVAFIRDRIVSFHDGDYVFEPLSEFARRYSSDAMARKFASLMDRIS